MPGSFAVRLVCLAAAPRTWRFWRPTQFGCGVRGPNLKYKVFFVGAYEYTTIHGSGPTTLLSTAPTSAGLSMLEGIAASPAVKAALAAFPVAPSNNGGTLAENGASIPVGSLAVVAPNFQREHDAQLNTNSTWGRHH